MKLLPQFLLAVAVATCLPGRAAPADDPKPDVPPAPSTQPAERGYVAFTPTPALALADVERERLMVPAKGGVVVVKKVLPGGPAEKAGLKVGDILVRYAGQAVLPPPAGRRSMHSARPSRGSPRR